MIDVAHLTDRRTMLAGLSGIVGLTVLDAPQARASVSASAVTPARDVATMAMGRIEIIAEDLNFPEGPIACDDGSVIVSELRSGNVTRVGVDGRKYPIAKVQGAVAGLKIGPDGGIYCCNTGGFIFGPNTAKSNLPISIAKDYSGGWIDRIDIKSGKVTRLYDSCDGLRLACPDDLIFDSNGGFWFSDVGTDVGNQELHGGVYYAKADGTSIRRIVYGIGINGIGLSPDGKTIYGAASYLRNILAFSSELAQTAPASNLFSSSNGGVSAEQARGPMAGRLITSYPGRQTPDSLAIEANGMIAQALVFQDSGISRINPETGETIMIPMPDWFTTNIAFGGSDMQTAYITLSATNRLARVRWPAPGLRLNYNG